MKYHETLPDTSQHPDNAYFGGDVISWVTISEDGWDARYGVIQPGFSQTFPTPETGERIWLHEPTGKQELEISVLDNDGHPTSIHYLSGEGSIVHVTGGHNIMVTTPKEQEAISYMCDYPGVVPENQ
jgi:hypothetical protein